MVFLPTVMFVIQMVVPQMMEPIGGEFMHIKVTSSVLVSQVQ